MLLVPSCEGIDVASRRPLVAIRSDVVGAHRVDADQQHIVTTPVQVRGATCLATQALALELPPAICALAVGADGGWRRELAGRQHGLAQHRSAIEQHHPVVVERSQAPRREVEGPGVVGETPVLQPGEEFSYSSACDLRSGFGRMDGSYLMVRLRDRSEFSVEIPTIQLSYAFGVN